MNTSRTIRLALASVTALTAVGVTGTPADATMYLQDEYEYAFTEQFELCGYTLDRTETGSGRVQFRAGTNLTDSHFFVHNNIVWSAVVTNPATGRSWTESFAGNYVDVKAERLTGDLFEVVGSEAGRLVIRDDDGAVVVRERGRIRTTFLFDTLGDDVPGGIDVGVVDIDVAGPHPLRDADPATVCSAVDELVG